MHLKGCSNEPAIIVRDFIFENERNHENAIKRKPADFNSNRINLSCNNNIFVGKFPDLLFFPAYPILI